MRQQFTSFWESIPKPVRSLLISMAGIVLAYISLQLAKVAFPGTDFTAVQGAILAAVGAWITSLVKDQVRIN